MYKTIPHSRNVLCAVLAKSGALSGTKSHHCTTRCSQGGRCVATLSTRLGHLRQRCVKHTILFTENLSLSVLDLVPPNAYQCVFKDSHANTQHEEIKMTTCFHCNTSSFTSLHGRMSVNTLRWHAQQNASVIAYAATSVATDVADAIQRRCG